jgi:inner membrane protein YhjD
MKLGAPVRAAIDINRRYGRHAGGYLSADIAYYAFLSLFPLLLLALSVVGFVLSGDPAVRELWTGRLAGSIPGLGPAIAENLRTVVSDRAATGVIGVAGLMWSGTALADASGYALSQVFGLSELKGFIRKKLWSLSSTVLLGALVIAGATVTSAVGAVAEAPLIGTAGLAVGFGLDFLLFMVAYRVLVQGRGPSWRHLWRGSLLAAAGWTMLKAAGAWYLARSVAGSTAVYGAFGSVVGMLAVLSLEARLFLYGAELSSRSIERAGSDEDTPARAQRVHTKAA